MDVPIDRILVVVRGFVETKRGKPADAIGANTALLRDGYLDSFALVELIAELEKQLAISLPDGSLIPEDFETPQVLHERLQEL
jgi:acyl carrier protein